MNDISLSLLTIAIRSIEVEAAVAKIRRFVAAFWFRLHLATYSFLWIKLESSFSNAVLSTINRDFSYIFFIV